MPRDGMGGPFDEANEVFARGVLEGESRASARPTRRRPRAQLIAVLAGIVAVLLLVWLLTRPGPAMEQNQNVDVGSVDQTAAPTPLLTEDAVLDTPAPVDHPAAGKARPAPPRLTVPAAPAAPAPAEPAAPAAPAEQPAAEQPAEQVTAGPAEPTTGPIGDLLGDLGQLVGGGGG